MYNIHILYIIFIYIYTYDMMWCDSNLCLYDQGTFWQNGVNHSFNSPPNRTRSVWPQTKFNSWSFPHHWSPCSDPKESSLNIISTIFNIFLPYPTSMVILSSIHDCLKEPFPKWIIYHPHQRFSKNGQDAGDVPSCKPPWVPFCLEANDPMVVFWGMWNSIYRGFLNMVAFPNNFHWFSE